MASRRFDTGGGSSSSDNERKKFVLELSLSVDASFTPEIRSQKLSVVVVRQQLRRCRSRRDIASDAVDNGDGVSGLMSTNTLFNTATTSEDVSRLTANVERSTHNRPQHWALEPNRRPAEHSPLQPAPSALHAWRRTPPAHVRIRLPSTKRFDSVAFTRCCCCCYGLCTSAVNCARFHCRRR
jgi:hypothetical protein